MDMCACLLHACMDKQYGSRCFGAEDIPGLHLGCPQMPYCCIRGRKLSNTGILHSVCEISPFSGMLSHNQNISGMDVVM